MGNVIAELCKYIIIILFAVYTLYCFTLFQTKDKKKQNRKYWQQRCLMFAVHLLCSLSLYLTTGDVRVWILYVLQFIFGLGSILLYQFFYRKLSRLLLNNMIMLLYIGFVMLERLNMEYAVKQFAIAALTMAVCLFIPVIIDKFPYFDRLKVLYAIAGSFLLALVFVIGKEVYGSKNWIVIGSFAMQPSEFVKIIFVFFAAAALAKDTRFSVVAKTTLVAAVHVLILVAEKDLGAALIYFVAYLSILYAATGNVFYMGAGIGGGCAAAALAYKFFSHVQTRVAAWRDPWSLIDDQGYQVTQSLFAIGTGGWFGMGLGQGMPYKIPVRESDFIYSAISEEMGAFFAICLILVQMSCFIMFVNISLKMKRQFYKLAAFGLSVVYIFQVFLMVGGVTKFIPSTGITLPLVSYGGSSVMSTIILYSVIQGMYVYSSDEQKEEA